jgi:hypothetical protein
MVLHGFDPIENSASDLMAFWEQQEFTEGTLDNSNHPTKRQSLYVAWRIILTTRDWLQSPLRSHKTQTNDQHPLISGAIYTKHPARAPQSVNWFSFKLLKCAIAGIPFVQGLTLTFILILLLQKLLVSKWILTKTTSKAKNVCPWYMNMSRQFDKWNVIQNLTNLTIQNQNLVMSKNLI